MQGYRSTG
ncbi:hypothetical protein VCHC80A1_02086A, partial [Vibrio cholerae HC-80A1]